MNKVDAINSRKNQIAFAIAEVIVNNSNYDFKTIFKYVKERVDSANVIIPNMDYFESTYEKKLNGMISEVNELVFYDVSLYLNNEVKAVNTLNIKTKDNEKIINKYNKNIKLYEKIGLTLDKYMDLYSFYGDAGMKMVDSKIKKLIRTSFLFEFKRDFSNFKDVMKYKKAINSLDKVFVDYNIKSIDDFINFRNEVLSFTLDEKKYFGEEKEFILENRENFKKRCNREISSIEAKKMVKKLDEVFNFEAFKTIFSDDCWKSVIERIGVNSKNICSITSSYASIMSASAMCSKYLDKNNEPVVYCIFPQRIFSLSPNTLNDIIIHEFVHSVDKYNINYNESFAKKYSQINEAITEYFSVEACKYLKEDLMKKDDCEVKKSKCVYDSMLSLVDILKKSKMWDDILRAKLYDDAVSLEKKYGVSTMSNIKSCFIGNLLAEQDLNDSKLEKLLNDIDKNLKNERVN